MAARRKAARQRHTKDVAESLCEGLFDIGLEIAQESFDLARQFRVAGNGHLARRHNRIAATQREREQAAGRRA